jgi:hypothetical protein
MAMSRVRLVYIIIAVVCKTVGALRSSRGGRRRGAVGIRRDDFPGSSYVCRLRFRRCLMVRIYI